MVVFTCNYCGDSLQKPKVEKHYQFSCKQPVFVTCVDCLKDFRENEFEAHTKCVTEDERYGGKEFNKVQRKGEAKQELWVEMIRSIIKEQKDLKPALRDLLHKIANFNNVPRKKMKFMNFIKSSTGGRINMNDVEAVWDIIENYKTKSLNTGDINTQKTVIGSKENNSASESVEAGTFENQDNCGKKPQQKDSLPVREHEYEPAEKKIKLSVTENTEKGNVKFNFKNKIIEILQSRAVIAPGKLQKKIKKLYEKETGKLFSDKVLRKYQKKVKEIENIEYTENSVKLCSIK